jgi:hypothetical protein
VTGLDHASPSFVEFLSDIGQNELITPISTRSNKKLTLLYSNILELSEVGIKNCKNLLTSAEVDVETLKDKPYGYKFMIFVLK